MSNEQTTSYARYQALRQAISEAVFLAECHRFEYIGTIEDCAEIAHDELWSALARALVEHAQPEATPDATAVGIVSYIELCITEARHAAGMPPLRIGAQAVRVPVLGTVVADGELGNRVEWAVSL